MNWIIKTLAGAVVAGVGWKMGVDAYEAIKKKVNEQADKLDEDKGADSGAAATQTEVVEVTEEDQPDEQPEEAR